MGEISLTSSQLTERYSLPVKVKETLTVQEIIHTQAGEIVLDMGQNMVGFVEFDSNLPAGTKVILDFGEVLQQGNFYNDNYRTQRPDMSIFRTAEGKRYALISPSLASAMCV